MTAIVGVLNKRGIAFAADSAATHSSNSGQKIANNANKLFALSKYYPIGIALYNNLDFMGIPWDTIIKLYRDNLGRTHYKTLTEYVDSFWKYVRSNFPPKGIQEWFVDLIVESYHNEIHELYKEILANSKEEAVVDKYIQEFYSKLEIYKNIFQGKEKSDEFVGYTIEEFKEHKDSINRGLSLVTIHLNYYPIDFKKKLVESLYEFLCTKGDTYLSYTGLVFFGYGENELYPSYREYMISCALDGHFKCALNRSGEVTNYNSSIIAPFAQYDVTNTVIRAVEDKLRQKFYDVYKLSLMGFREEVAAQLMQANAPKKVVDIIRSLDVDKYARKYREGMDNYIQKEYIDSLVDTVSYLSKEDLADMAESLVRMTSIKRHITDSQETVGGPVDVAVITKGDGFVWIKRKHYFDPSLNPQFFERYNK
jgi:hypothetical protein